MGRVINILFDKGNIGCPQERGHHLLVLTVCVGYLTRLPPPGVPGASFLGEQNKTNEKGELYND